MSKLDISRRRVAQAIGAGAALGAIAGCAAPEMGMRAKNLGRIVVVGAGFGGATTAKYLKHWGGDNVAVTLIDRNPEFVSCPISNLVLGGSKSIAEITTSYEGLRKLGVNVIVDEVRQIDTARRRVVLAKTSDQSYDRVVVSPGIEFNFAAIRGLDERAQQKILHAWKAGQQTVDLRRLLEAMPDGGVYVLSIPLAPYRCPPGPYERISQVAHYFKTTKPRAKVIALDANPGITSKGPLFSKFWNDNYKGIIDYRPNSPVTQVDAASLTAITEFGDRVSAHVLNVVPQQTSGRIAHETGLVNANNRWCTVDWTTLESTAVKNVHVLGDATLSAPGMPKSGHMANQHGKAAAAAIIEIMSGRAPQSPMMANTCYSFVDDKNVIHVASVHRYDAEKKTMVAVPGSGGVSSAANMLEGVYANAWAQNIWRDMFA
ncbi:MAG: FCSD flavin-binding domain-containing protein [Burkholderiaceae bacterium]|nr:FCSD flavin-binding domain-containing protein [Burkholderiaceae bacterium]